MKKSLLFAVILFFAGLSVSMAQTAQLNKINTIPVYNYPLTEESAFFQEQGAGTDNYEKRDVTIVVTSSSKGIKEGTATIMLVKNDGSESMGPYTVVADEPLSVDLPKGKWGVIVNSRGDLDVSIWISKGGSIAL